MKRISQLDSLKFLAMVGVFFNHCTFLKRNPLTDDFFETYLHFGGVYVELFIILSGFFAAYTCHYYSWNKTRHLSYLKRKAIRLFPVYWSCSIAYLLVLSLIGCLVINFKTIISTIFSVFLLQSITPYTWSFVNAPSWTISTLWILYFFVPFLLVVAKKLSIKKCLLLLFFVGMFYTIINACFFHYSDITIWLFYICPLTRVLSFFMGMLLAIIFLQNPKLHFAILKKSASLIEIITIVLVMVLCVSFRNYSREGYLYVFLLLLLIFVLISGKGYVSRMLNNTILLRLSKYSYAFYLVHYIILTIVTIIVEKNDITRSWQLTIFTIVAFLFTLLISIPMHNVLEKQIGDYLKLKLL